MQPNQLQKGDVFSEDTYPERFEVVDFMTVGSKPAVVGESLEDGSREIFTGGGPYQQPLILHERG